jgi:hypothetical protein
MPWQILIESLYITLLTISSNGKKKTKLFKPSMHLTEAADELMLNTDKNFDKPSQQASQNISRRDEAVLIRLLFKVATYFVVQLI